MMRSWLTGGPKEVQEDLILPVFCRMSQGERVLRKYMRFSFCLMAQQIKAEPSMRGAT